MNFFKNIALAFALIITLFAGCKNPAEDVDIIVDTDIFKSPILLQFINAKDGAEGPKTFTVEISGPGASLVRTPTGGKVFKVSDGAINLLLDRTANPSPTSPVKFTVIANVPGFAPTFQDVTIASATDPTIIQVSMNEYANPATNTGTIVATKAVTNGTATSEIVFTTATNANMAQKSDIIIPSGTVFLDGNGQPVGGGQVEARIVHYNTGAANSPAPLPGGNFARNVIGTNGQPIPNGTFLIPVGAVSIDMFGGSKEVKSFSKPVTVDMEVSPTTINPNTDQHIKEGETIQMWSLNDETGQWKVEGNATIQKNGSGTLVARMQINHLSLWASLQEVYPCSTGKIVVIEKPVSDNDETFTITDYFSEMGTYSVVIPAGQTSLSTTINTIARQSYIKVQAQSDAFQNKQISNFSNCGVKTISKFILRPEETLKISVDVKFNCTNKNLQTGINSFVTITPVGKSSANSTVYQLKKGVAAGVGVVGQTYDISASVDGVTYKGQFTVEKKSSTLATGLDVTGTVTYSAAQKKLTIKGFVSKNCN